MGADIQSKRINAIKEAFDNLDVDFRYVLGSYVKINFAGGMTAHEMVDTYRFFLAGNDKEEKYFFEHGHYRYCKLEEVISHVYNNAEYMQNI